MTIAELIGLVKSAGSGLAKPMPVEAMPDMVFVCSFEQTGVTNLAVSEIVSKCPDDLAEFWGITRSARLFEDMTFGQWGLAILDPHAAVAATEKFRTRRSRDFMVGDLVLGRLIGDSDRLIIRCDPVSADFGHILVATPLDSRAHWHGAAVSFTAFLEKYIKTGGEKYWARPCPHRSDVQSRQPTAGAGDEWS
ncbi:MAG: hypothetical protein ACK5UC_27135 [Planctomycetaceae bacterium]